MQRNEADRTRGGRLRFVFSDEVVSFELAEGVTYGDIALALGELSDRHYRHPVAIDLTLLPSRPGAGRPPAATIPASSLL